MGTSPSDSQAKLTEPSVATPAEAENIALTIGKALGDSLKQAWEAGPYKRFKQFSGSKPVPAGEEDYDTWKAQAEQISQDWSCSDMEVWKRITESLKGPASDLIYSLRMSNPAATASDYFTALENAFGSLETGEDLYFQKLSDYFYCLEKLLQKCKHHKGLDGKSENRTRLEQVIRGAVYEELLILQLKVKDRLENPPDFPQLLREVREEESKRSAREQSKVCVNLANTSLDRKTVGERDTKLYEQIDYLSKKMEELPAAQAKGKPPQIPRPQHLVNQTRRPRGNRFCFRCGEDGHTAPICDNPRNESKVAQRKKEQPLNSKAFSRTVPHCLHQG
uniref:CCHC-type domain-containing protein n=1 Tax=Xenopus tropicalis TaxID=8364 RepID=A0A6I8QMM5_XENTR